MMWGLRSGRRVPLRHLMTSIGSKQHFAGAPSGKGRPGFGHTRFSKEGAVTPLGTHFVRHHLAFHHDDHRLASHGLPAASLNAVGQAAQLARAGN